MKKTPLITFTYQSPKSSNCPALSALTILRCNEKEDKNPPTYPAKKSVNTLQE